MDHITTRSSVKLLDAATATGAGEAMSPVAVDRTYQAQGAVSASTGAATVLIEVSDVASPGTNDWLLLATITLTLGTTSTSDGTYSNTNWRWVRARLSAISGTNASVTVWMGC